MSAKPKARRSELPAKARSFDDVEFDPRQDVWRFRSGLQSIHIDLGALDGCSPELAAAFRRLILWYVQRRSASLANGIYTRFLHFVRSQVADTPIAEITASHILGYRSSLPEGQRWYLTTLAGAFRRWLIFDLPGINADAERLLRQLRLQGNRKGEAVRTACPISGPLTDIEFSALVSAVNSAFRAGALPRESYTLALLCMTLGLRPVQLAALKTIDLLPAGDDGQTTLRVPRAKQQGQGSRVTFKERSLVPTLARLLEAHVAEVAERLKGQGCPSGYPMFPASSGSAAAFTPSFEWHCTGLEIHYRVRSALERVGVHSERTGLPLRLNPTRLRRTLGTRAAAEGRGIMVIAEMLDHSDLQNASVYVEARPDIIDRLDEALARSLAPLARAFVGEFEGDHSITEAPGGAIRDPRFGHRGPLGRCGSSGNCQLTAPAGCYTCTSFRAWRDGPHHEVLQHLLAERLRLKELGSERVAAANDRAILALAQIVQLCDEMPDV